MISKAYLIQKLISIPLILIALTGHELAHGLMSYKLGDPTPKAEGRLTLNPFKHLDLVGTILMLVAGFGWAKPVMINPQYYKNRKVGTALTALAGPLANFIMAFLAIALYAVFARVCIAIGFYNYSVISAVYSIAVLFASYNLSLMLFNLIPIPPLDGSKVLGAALPNRTYYKMLQYERYYSAVLIILVFVLLRFGVFDNFIYGGIELILNAIIKLFA
ncbi:MAG: site-2 protease family protein [Firmicutes bacterium]|nr:site-2 protease family protein [Bacillota bacterium]